MNFLGACSASKTICELSWEDFSADANEIKSIEAVIKYFMYILA